MKCSSPESIVFAVRNYARNTHFITPKKTAEDLGLTNQQVSKAIAFIQAQGFVRSVKHGVYEWVNNETNIPIASTSQDKVWRALKINPTFTSAEVARQAGVATTYAARKLRDYRNAGYVERHGVKRNESNVIVRVWRLTPKGRARIDRPSLVDYEPDPLIEKMVKLNRLVCTGVALRRDVDRSNAIALCDEIRSKLIESGETEEAHESE